MHRCNDIYLLILNKGGFYEKKFLYGKELYVQEQICNQNNGVILFTTFHLILRFTILNCSNIFNKYAYISLTIHMSINSQYQNTLNIFYRQKVQCIPFFFEQNKNKIQYEQFMRIDQLQFFKHIQSLVNPAVGLHTITIINLSSFRSSQAFKYNNIYFYICHSLKMST